ncbi:MAG: MmgE/PrpD family protein, partial [Chloroflexota bacterium]
MNKTKELAEFVVATGYSGLSGDAVEAAKRCVIDWLGVTVAGSREPAASILAGLMAESGGKK